MSSVEKKNILVTGGHGFIGSNFILKASKSSFFQKIINLDNNSYSSNSNNLKKLSYKDYLFVDGDINDQNLIFDLLSQNQIDIIFHFAAESHVDRSIHDSSKFILTNINGTHLLLQQSLKYLKKNSQRKNFKFIHISTDEVFGSLQDNDPPFREDNPYLPNSPYAASKASSDLIVRSFIKTFDFPAIITNCSNNYGPYQYPEKLIPLVIYNCLQNKDIPIYGNGTQIRDWLFVEDHCSALIQISNIGNIGESYNIGGNHEITNIELVKMICRLLDDLSPKQKGRYEDLISHVKDRPGHDYRYAINTTKILNDLKWLPSVNFQDGLKKTVLWYLDNSSWMQDAINKNFQNWTKQNYGNR